MLHLSSLRARCWHLLLQHERRARGLCFRILSLSGRQDLSNTAVTFDVPLLTSASSASVATYRSAFDGPFSGRSIYRLFLYSDCQTQWEIHWRLRHQVSCEVKPAMYRLSGSATTCRPSGSLAADESSLHQAASNKIVNRLDDACSAE